MAQIIKNRRGSIGNVKDVTTQNGEIIVASGSIGDLSGPFILYGSPTPSDNGLAGVYKPASKIYQGANVPTISVGTYGNVLDGTPFYSSASKALYILNAAGNTLMDLAGNLSGSVFPYIIASGSFSGSFQGDGSGLTNISASSIVGLSLNSIQTGSVTASVDIGNISYQVVSSSVDLFSVYNNGLVAISGSLIVLNGITGSLLGTSSYAVNALSSSYAFNATSASYALNSTSASYALSSSYSNTATSASYAFNATSASFATNALTASYVATASYIPNLQEVTNQGSSTTNAITASGLAVNGPAYISGNLDVNGTITYISSSTLQIGDNIIEINSNKAAGNSGMIVYDTTAPFTASLLWNATTDRWIAGPYGSESVIILASDTSSMSVNFARTSSYSTTLGASLTSSAPDQVRLLASDGSTLSTITVNNVTSASYALSASYAFNSTSASYAFNSTSASYALSASYANNATSASYAFNATSASYALTSSYINPLIQNVIVTGSVTATTGFYDGTGAGVIQFAYLNASKQLAYLTPSTAGDLIQWNGTAMTASNLIDGGTF